MSDKVKPRNKDNRKGTHGTPKKGWKSKPFLFGKSEPDKRKGARKFIAFAAILALIFGCTSYKGGKIAEGMDIAAGLSVPQSGGNLQVDAFNFMSGFRFLFAEDAGVGCTYSVSNHVSIIGIYESSSVKSVEITLEPSSCTNIHGTAWVQEGEK